MLRRRALVISSPILVSALLLHHDASAQGLEACGNISLELDAQCEVEPPGLTCEARCTPVAVQASCAADLTVTCQNECTETVVEREVQVCSENCITQCEVDPGAFECGVDCDARCGGGCSASCSGSADQSRCEASCHANCSAECSAECKVVLPTATCEEKCQPSCRAVVIAERNLDCQLDCQSDGFADCEATLTGGCKVDCESEEGALFCDGQFVDHDDQLQQCIDALENLEFKVNVDASVSFSTSGCTVGGNGGLPLTLGGLALLGLVAWRRRRRAARS